MKIIEIESGEYVMDKLLAVLNTASVEYSVYDSETKVNRNIKFSKDDIVKGKMKDLNKVTMFKNGETLLAHLYGLNCISVYNNMIYLFKRISEDEYKVVLIEYVDLNNELQFYSIRRMLHDSIDDDSIFKVVISELKRIYYNKIS